MTIPSRAKATLSLSPKKSLGQNFLADERYLDQILAAAELTRADTVLEIGAGLGTLTRRLATQAGHVITVELDDRLIASLRVLAALQPNIRLVHGDILELDPAELVANAEYGVRNAEFSASTTPYSALRIPHSYKVVANIPYYITSAILRRLLEASTPPTLAVLMVQKEVAERICAAPGDLSLLAISVQFYATPSIITTVPAAAFRPRPQVDSAVLRLITRPQPAVTTVTPTEFFGVVRAGFSQKRKQLLSNLSKTYSREQLEEIFNEVGLALNIRAEDVSLHLWLTLAEKLLSPTIYTS